MAEKSAIVLGDERIPMERSEDGWWVFPETLGPGSDYAFLVDGEGPFPDPRSPRLPHGVHGPSCTYDHDAFSWEHTTFRAPPIASGIVYEAHVGTFTAEGTFDAMIGRLDHLVDLGVTHLELMPVCAFSGSRGWGYDGVGLFAPHEAYGGPDGLKRLVDACHGKGLAVILDVVYNHLGPEGNYLPKFGPYFTDKHHTPWGDAINFDGPHSDEVRRFFCDNALMWLADYQFDGLRIDAVHAIFDMSAVHFLEQLALEVEALEASLGRPFTLIAESDLNDPRIVRPRHCGGYGIHAQWSDDFHHAVHSLLTGESDGYYEDFGFVRHLAKAMKQPFVYAGEHSSYRKRRHGKKAQDLHTGQFVVCSQNHDQVGNRAAGDRLCHISGFAAAKAAAALVILSPYVPLLFQGEEWAASSPFQYFTDHKDEDLAEAVSKGRRGEFAAFGWNSADVPDPQAYETFERSKLDWNELEFDTHLEMLEWYKKLIALRQKIADLHGDVAVSYEDKIGLFMVQRGSLLLVCNLSKTDLSLSASISSSRQVLLSTHSRVEMNEKILPPYGVLIMEGH